MWLTVASVAIGGLVVLMIGTEIVRAIVSRRRERTTGVGGAHDVFLYSLPLQFVLIVIGLVSLVLHATSR